MSLISDKTESTPRPLILVKFGGSLITDKAQANTPRLDVIRRLAEEIARAHRDARPNSDRASDRASNDAPDETPAIVLGHGSGSFGHQAAHRFGLAGGIQEPGQLPGIPATRERAEALHRLVLEALREAGEVPFTIAPSSALVADNGKPVQFELGPLELALDLGLLPVLFGDVVLDRQRGVSICSTETVLTAVAEGLPKERWKIRQALWLGVTEGILDSQGHLLEAIDAASTAEALAAVGGSDGIDVTGGMKHRLESCLRLAELGIPSQIVDGSVPGLLAAALSGETVRGTTVESLISA